MLFLVADCAEPTEARKTSEMFLAMALGEQRYVLLQIAILVHPITAFGKSLELHVLIILAT